MASAARVHWVLCEDKEITPPLEQVSIINRTNGILLKPKAESVECSGDKKKTTIVIPSNAYELTHGMNCDEKIISTNMAYCVLLESKAGDIFEKQENQIIKLTKRVETLECVCRQLAEVCTLLDFQIKL